MTRLHVAHASMQFSDSNRQMVEDVNRIFDRMVERKVSWLTGTEAGPGADPLTDLLRQGAKEHGYRFFKPKFPTDCWVAVSRDLITGNWETGYENVIPGSSALYKEQGIPADSLPRWGPKGVVWVGFDTESLGRIYVSSAHYLTQGRRPNRPIKGVDHYEWNKRLALAIGDWAVDKGSGAALAFYGGDQNIVDRTDDTFFGAPLTSAWDELARYENTGHGNIDVIASYDKDSRVKARYSRALDDSEFPLHTDHFLVEAGFSVEPLPTKPEPPQPVAHDCPLCGHGHEGVLIAP